ncbi:hypothetical protein C818_04185 [Lachnospiraceae bacterium MD308]|nr:hypothetical protein C818_04185 [Lachnospiraceae bacterium MD308]
MKKKLLGMILLFTIIFSFGCSSSHEQSTSEDVSQEAYSQHETTFGLSYEIPDSWKTPDTNSDTEIYHYKKEIGSGDGMLYIIYQEIDGDILTETSFNEFADGLLNSGYDTDGFQSEDFESNNIKMKKFNYNMEIEQTKYKTQGVVFNCYEGIVMIAFSSFSESNYDSYFDKIISSVKSTDAIEDEFNENIVQNEDETEPIEDNTESADDNISTFDFSTYDTPYKEIDISNLSIKHGELLSVIYSDGTVTVKTKIEPSFNNKATIDQNYFTVADLVKNHGFNTCEKLSYWAVADMEDGEEAKCISFDLNKKIIDNLYNENIVENQLGNYADELWILPSLQE